MLLMLCAAAAPVHIAFLSPAHCGPAASGMRHALPYSIHSLASSQKCHGVEHTGCVHDSRVQV